MASSYRRAGGSLLSARMRVEGYSSCPVCLRVCPFSVFCLLALLSVQREVSVFCLLALLGVQREVSVFCLLALLGVQREVSVFCLLALLGVQREVSVATAWKMQQNYKAIFSKTA